MRPRVYAGSTPAGRWYEGNTSRQELRALVEVKAVQMEVSAQEMFDTADVLARALKEKEEAEAGGNAPEN